MLLSHGMVRGVPDAAAVVLALFLLHLISAPVSQALSDNAGHQDVADVETDVLLQLRGRRQMDTCPRKSGSYCTEHCQCESTTTNAKIDTLFCGNSPSGGRGRCLDCKECFKDASKAAGGCCPLNCFMVSPCVMLPGVIALVRVI